MKGLLTTHVLDTANGCPGEGITVELYQGGISHFLLASCVTNSDGRCDEPLLKEDDMGVGEYELVFHVGDYFVNKGTPLSDQPFLNEVVIRFGISSRHQHYHVPLLVSPWGYTTYRGS